MGEGHSLAAAAQVGAHAWSLHAVHAIEFFAVPLAPPCSPPPAADTQLATHQPDHSQAWQAAPEGPHPLQAMAEAWQSLDHATQSVSLTFGLVACLVWAEWLRPVVGTCVVVGAAWLASTGSI